MLSLGLALVTVIGVSQGYPYGAPACVSAPRHGFDPQEGDTHIEIIKAEEATETRESFYEGLITKNVIAEDMYFVEKRDIRVSLHCAK